VFRAPGAAGSLPQVVREYDTSVNSVLTDA